MMRKLSRLFFNYKNSFFRAVCSQPFSSLNTELHIGTLKAEDTVERLTVTFVQEMNLASHKVFAERMQAELVALKQLCKKREDVRSDIYHQGVVPLLHRYQQGYSIKGLFWLKIQNEMREKIAPENLELLEQQIDWLTLRQNLYQQVTASVSQEEGMAALYKL